MQTIIIIKNTTNNNVLTNLYAQNNIISAYNIPSQEPSTILPGRTLTLTGTIPSDLNAYLFDGTYATSPYSFQLPQIVGSSYGYQVSLNPLSINNLDKWSSLNSPSNFINSVTQCTELYKCLNKPSSSCSYFEKNPYNLAQVCKSCNEQKLICETLCSTYVSTSTQYIECLQTCCIRYPCPNCDSACNPYEPLSSFCQASCAGASTINPVCGPVNGSNYNVPASISYSNNTYTIVVGGSGASYGSLKSTDNTATNSFIATQTGPAYLDFVITLPYSLSTFFGTPQEPPTYLEIDCNAALNANGDYPSVFVIETASLPPASGGTISQGSSVSGTISIAAGTDTSTTVISGQGLQMSSGSLALNEAATVQVFLSGGGLKTQVAQFGNLVYLNS